MDSPAHFLPAGEHRTIDQLTAAEMVSEGAVLDFSYKEPGTGITREEMETEAEKHRVGPGDYAILKLGTKPRDDDEYLMEYVYPTDGAVEHLLDRGIICLASEALNVDRSRQSIDEHTVHHLLLEEDVFIVEGLDNLETTEEGRYDVICTPLPYVGRDGSQVRFLVRAHES
jgi:arylformamidase